MVVSRMEDMVSDITINKPILGKRICSYRFSLVVTEKGLEDRRFVIFKDTVLLMEVLVDLIHYSNGVEPKDRIGD